MAVNSSRSAGIEEDDEMNIRWMRWIIVVVVICAAILAAGYRLTQVEPETAAAAPAVSAPAPMTHVALNGQATSLEQVRSRGLQTAVEPVAVFTDNVLDYRLSYPANWQMFQLSSTVALFQTADGVTRVKVEAAGPLPADGLSAFVTRSLGQSAALSRQALTIHGQPAERVVTFADTPGGQVTTFYVQVNTSVYVLTGQGQQAALEKVARSFNAPQAAAQR
jgi:hypothetical protein